MSEVDAQTTDFVTALARLLSDPSLRLQFCEEPEHVARQIGVAQEDWHSFVSISPEQLNRQAETLLNKRWHEVRRLVPKTIEMLGSEAVDLFRFYATKEWPQGHRRHSVDAHRFLRFLISNEIAKPEKYEMIRIRRMAN